MLLTLLSISAVGATDNETCLESQTQDAVELESINDEEVLSNYETGDVLQVDERAVLNRSYSFNPAEVDRDNPYTWINMDVDASYGLDEGNVSIIFNKTLLEQRSLSWMSYYGIDVDLPYLDYGQYNFTIYFNGNSYFKPFVDIVPFNVSYRFVPLINGEISLSYDLKYGDTAYLSVFLPYGTYDKINITYNGKKQEVWVWDGEATLVLDELVFGKQDLIMEYEDYQYPYKKVVRTINVAPIVDVSETVAYGDTASVNVSMNGDANGNISLSIDGVEIYNNPVLNGKANINFLIEDLGNHDVVIRYLGDDYSFNPIIKSVSSIPKVTAPRVMGLNEETMIYLELPSSYSGYIAVYRGNDTFYGSVFNGHGSVKLSNLSDILENLFEIEYSGSGYFWRGSCYINVVNVTPDGYVFEVDVPYNVFKEGYAYCPINIPDSAIGTITVWIDGHYFDEISTDSRFYSYDFSAYGMDIGTKSIQFRYSGEDYFKAKKYTATFCVYPFEVECPETVLFGYSEELKVIMAEGYKGYLLLYIDGEEYAIGFANPVETFSLHNVSFEKHDWKVKYIDEDLSEITQNGSFDVGFYNKTVADHAVYGDVATVKVYVPDDATGNVVLNIANRVYKKQPVNGEVIFEVPDLAGGAYFILVTYEGDDKYPESTIWTDDWSFPSVWVEYLIVMTREDIRFNESSTIYFMLPEDATGKLVVWCDEDKYIGDFIDGNASVVLSNLSVGYHALYCYYSAYDYMYNSYIYGITVHGYEIGLSSKEMNLKDNETISISLPSNAAGNLIVWDGYDNLYANVSLVNGKASVSLANLTLGTHSISALYDGGDYEVDYLWENVDVGLNTTVPEEIQSGDDKFITVDVPADSQGQLYASFSDGEKYIDIDGENGRIPLAGLPVGEYYVSISYVDVKYGGYYSYGNRITVKRPSPKIDIFLTNDNTTLAVSLPKDATGDVIVEIDDVLYFKTLSDGKVTIDIGTVWGEHTFGVRYSGCDLYAPGENSTTMNIPIIPKKTTITVLIIEGFKITSVLKDSEGNALTNRLIAYSLNGGPRYAAYTDSKGEFTVTAADNSRLAMEFFGNEFYSMTKTEIVLKNMVPKQIGTQIEAENPFTRTAVDYKAGERGYMFYFTLKDENGKVLPNKQIKIGIDGKIYTVRTDATGKAGQMINMANENSYTYALCFLGDDDYKASFAVSRLIVVKKAVTITPAKTSYSFTPAAKTKTVTATLKSTNSYIPKGKQVTLAIAGQTFKATIGDKGQISFNIGSVTKKGTYSVNIKYAGDVTYAAATSKTITVKIT